MERAYRRVSSLHKMKAAVLHQFGGVPVYEQFPDPVPASADQLLLNVKAAAIKNIDKLRASGTHYASYKEVPVVVGIDGVGLLVDGTRVYAQGITGTIAEEAIVKTLREIHAGKPIDLVIDYLWGRPIEILLNALKSGGIGVYTHRVRIVTVGSMAGENIGLGSGVLRSSAIEILGSGLGSISEENFRLFNTVMLPELFKLAGAGRLHLETITADIKDIAEVWPKEVGA